MPFQSIRWYIGNVLYRKRLLDTLQAVSEIEIGDHERTAKLLLGFELLCLKMKVSNLREDLSLIEISAEYASLNDLLSDIKSYPSLVGKRSNDETGYISLYDWLADNNGASAIRKDDVDQDLLVRNSIALIEESISILRRKRDASSELITIGRKLRTALFDITMLLDTLYRISTIGEKNVSKGDFNVRRKGNTG